MKEQIWQRWSEHRPGMKLAAVIPTAVEVIPINMDCILHTKSEYPLTNQFVLKCLHAGLFEVEHISNFLGIGREIVSEVISEELRAGTIAQMQSGRLALTEAGKDRLSNLELNKNVREPRTLFQDAVTRKLVSYPDLATSIKGLHPGEEGEDGTGEFIKLEPSPLKKLKLNSFSLQEINDVVGKETTKVIQVKGFSKPKGVRYKAAWLLVFSDINAEDFAVDVLIDGEISISHGVMQSPEAVLSRFDVKVEFPKSPPNLSQALAGVEQKTPSAIGEIIEAVREIESLPMESDSGVAFGTQIGKGIGMFQVQDEAPSRVSVFEHAEILKQALKFAQARLMIFSPWVKGGVVNNYFLADLKNLLRRGVEVTFVYGIGDAEDNTQWSLDRLCELSNEFSHFHFLRHNNTHAKAFIVDDSVIITSFNWLSFKGDERRTYRMEEGMKYSGKSVADPWYYAYQELLAQEASFACQSTS
jgi:hypothetical protein